MTQEILVVGATGKTGRRVVRSLETRGITVRKASRSTGFDWNDTTTWKPFLEGADAVYLIAPEDPAAAAPFTDLATTAGVRRLVLLSGRGLDETPPALFEGMRAAEAALRASTATWTILRANNFTQNFSEEVWQAEVEAGTLSLPVDDTPEPFVDVADIAEAAALALTTDDHHGRTYNLSGPEPVTFDTALAKISAATGRTTTLTRLTPDEYAQHLRAQGVPDEVVTELNMLYEGMRAGVLATPTTDLETLLGRPATSFDTYVAETWS
ncbi:NAD(P)H-binding protein [Lentzea sp. CC55]|uniref:NAD(P)H-binding protein n=1 Tax=Lentzea sp. CC55 TaxID=2884909 RepID=UPI001F2C37B5|nr:NAD(P)H-binding protein [Lentzea sp. CC55]MCG8926139.1 NAD(P)H-binding protein [Lentzea sp. CC55]